MAIKPEETPSGKIVRRDESSGEIHGSVSREGKNDIPTPAEPKTSARKSTETAEDYTLRLSPVETINLIRHSNLSANSLKTLARSKDPGVRMAILDSSEVTPAILDYLVSSSPEDEYRLRLGVARRHDLSPLTMARLIGDPIPVVRAKMAQNHNLLPNQQNDLLFDSDPLVRAHLASSRQVTVEVLEHLAKDPDPSVQLAVASNERTSPDVLFTMQVVYGNNNIKLLEKIASNRNASINTLETLSRFGNVSIRAAVAYNVSTPDEVLDELSKDTSTESLPVIRKLVENSRLSEETLYALSKVTDARVRESIANHFNSNADTLDSLAEANDFHIRMLVCDHPNTRLELLKAFSRRVDLPEDLRNEAADRYEQRTGEYPR